MDQRIKPLVVRIQETIIARCTPWANALNVNVSVGRKDDPSTWRLDFADDVTNVQKQQAMAELATLTVADFSVVQPMLTLEERIAKLEEVEVRIAKLESDVQALSTPVVALES